MSVQHSNDLAIIRCSCSFYKFMPTNAIDLLIMSFIRGKNISRTEVAGVRARHLLCIRCLVLAGISR